MQKPDRRWRDEAINRAKRRPDLIIVALSETPFLYDFRSPGVAMFIAIGSFNLDEYRKSVRTLSDEDLIKGRKEDALALRRRKDREHDAVCVLRAVEGLQTGMAKKASEMILCRIRNTFLIS